MRWYAAIAGEGGERVARPGIVIDGTSLTCAQVASVARGAAGVRVAAAARSAAREAWQVAREVAGHRPVYGRTTGVGAKRNVEVTADEAAQHGLHVLRSHAAGPARCSTRNWAGPCWWSG